MQNYENVWEKVCSIVKNQTTPISFETWIKPVKINKIDDTLSIVYLEVASDRGKELIINNLKDRYLSLLQSAFSDVLDGNYRVVVKEANEYLDEEKEKPKVALVKVPGRKIFDSEKLFNPKFTFENFVVGNSNKYAHAASVAVAETPSQAYNPLFIYGGPGLGKTHLMHAIGIYILNRNPKAKVLYVSSEMFTNEMIKALSENKIEDFKLKYRNVDVLLIDDIQFFEGKRSTQEEFFYTFEELYRVNKQIIISSDRAPNKLDQLDKRLTSRFQYSLVADIQPPDYETRVAILQKKAENLQIEMNDELYEVICLIAEKIKDNIRELEGAFIRIVSFSKLTNERIDKNFAKRILKDILSGNETQVTPEKIKKEVCKRYNIKLADLESNKRTNLIAFPRQIAMYLIRELTDSSLPQIGKMFGGKDHTTVKYACEKIEAEMKIDDELRTTINDLKNELKE